MKLQHKQFAFKTDAVGEDGRFSGYASTFGNVDLGGEIVVAGAFTESLKAIKDSGDPLPMLWQHQTDQPIGGFDNLAEDSHGLKTEGFLMTAEIPLAAQAQALLKRRVVKAMSIGYYVEAASYNEKTDVLSLLKLDLREVSLVTFPMNPKAEVDALKAMVEGVRQKGGALPTVREFEGSLRDAGYSKAQAAFYAARALRESGGRDARGGKSAAEILDSFKL